MTHIKNVNSVVGHAEIFSKHNKKYGPIYRGWTGSKGMVAVSSPEAAEVNEFVHLNLHFFMPRHIWKVNTYSSRQVM
jgi:hypothetical protein